MDVEGFTVTMKSQLVLLLQQSVATQCTVVTVPGPNILPEDGVKVTVTLLQQPATAVAL